MHRFFIPPDQCQGPGLCLSGGEAHHALHVLRVREGDRVGVLDGAGLEWLCRVQACSRDGVGLQVVEERRVPRAPCRITLLQAVPKGRLMEFIVEKATELGAARIVPLLAERVLTRLDASEARARAAKWQATAIEAIKQCGSAWLPHIEAPLSPGQFLARRESFDLPLLASLQNDSRHPRHYFRAFHAAQGGPPRTVCVWIGPEGDFTPEESAAITAAGALPITLGPLVLRTETAALYCLSVLSYESGAEPAAKQRGMDSSPATC